MFQSNARSVALAITTAAFFLLSTDTQGGQASAENTGKFSDAAQEPALTYTELEAQIGAYLQYHAEEELLACLRDAKSDPKIRGTHKVGPRLKQLEVQQKRYADFRSIGSGLSPEDRRRIERKIIELHLQQEQHIEFVRGLFANGRATTDQALLDYHSTGCIDGLKNVVEDIRTKREAEQQAEKSAGAP